VAGVLVPLARPAEPIIALSRDGLRLWRSLGRPRRLDRVLPRPLDDASNIAIARLILDGTFAIEQASGRFVSRADALESVVSGRIGAAPAGRTGRLSVLALARAASLHSGRVDRMADLLYRFNTRPAGARWRSEGGHPADLLRRLAPARIATAFQPESRGLAPHAGASDSRWVYWYRRLVRGDSAAAPYKLYLSPVCEQALDAFHLALAVVADTDALALKIGRGVHGLLRPDKLVIYFRTHEELRAAVPLLLGALRGVGAQGVPLSVALTEDALLSWGVDPPGSVLSDGIQSWRTWLSGRLACALASFRASASPAWEPWQFALAYTGLDGVDSATLTPPAHWYADDSLQ
jgi:hypothetical protein